MAEFFVNSFQVPNTLVDEIMGEISGNALKCLMLIVRQTRGWHKQSDCIAMSVFMDKCGLKSKHTAIASLRELENIGLIECVKSARQNGLNEYRLTDQFNRFEYGNSSAKNAPVQKMHGAKNTDSSAKNAPPSAKNAPPAVQKMHPQKTSKNTIQNTNTKDISVGDAQTPDESPKIPESKKSTSAKNPKFDFRQALLDAGVSERNADDWMEVRRLKKAANTETAFERLRDQAVKAGLSLDAAVSFSAGMSWRGFEADWYANAGGGNARASPAGKPKFSNPSLAEHLANQAQTQVYQEPQELEHEL